jgi:hypothetical protein
MVGVMGGNLCEDSHSLSLWWVCGCLKEMLKKLRGKKKNFLCGEFVDKKMWRFVEITPYTFWVFFLMFF